MTEILLFI